VLAQALDATSGIRRDNDYARALARLAPLLPADQRANVQAHALAAATSFSSYSDRAYALAQLAPYLPENLLAQALAATSPIRSEQIRAEALNGLAPYLPETLLAQALATTTTITSGHWRAKALASLAPYLPAGLLTQALAATPRTSAKALAALLARGQSIISSDNKKAWAGLLRESFRGTGRHACLSLITTAAPAIAEIGGEEAIKESVKAITDVHQWWP
jgi:hypothetical protein